MQVIRQMGDLKYQVIGLKSRSGFQLLMGNDHLLFVFGDKQICRLAGPVFLFGSKSVASKEHVCTVWAVICVLSQLWGEWFFDSLWKLLTSTNQSEWSQKTHPSRQITCVCWAEDLQEDRCALLDNTGLGGRRSQSSQTPRSHCMLGTLLRSFTVVVVMHGLWAEERKRFVRCIHDGLVCWANVKL